MPAAWLQISGCPKGLPYKKLFTLNTVSSYRYLLPSRPLSKLREPEGLPYKSVAAERGALANIRPPIPCAILLDKLWPSVVVFDSACAPYFSGFNETNGTEKNVF